MKNTTIVALDLETTGLNADTDRVIEIGAVRFRGSRIEDEFQTLVNPQRRLNPYITRLTGITDAMLRGAPPIEEVLPALQDFVGDAPILGHNIGFDLRFLQRYGLFRDNDALDTYEMAAVLIPNAGRYALGALGSALNIPLPASHRALDDVYLTHRLYLRLLEMAKELPLQILTEIVRLGDNVPDWKGYGLFFEALRDRSGEIAPPPNKYFFLPWLERFAPPESPPLEPLDPPQPLDPEEVVGILQHGGEFSRYFEQYEHRPEQVEMLRAVTRAFSEGRHLLVEAGTGVGKSFAYLIPAALWALQNGERVVISTNTINLQEQLINKDIPDLKAALQLDELAATVLKGRNNYLCPRRLENMRRRLPETAEEVRIMGKVLVWLAGGGSGDRTEINLNGPAEREVWSRLSARDDACTAENCLRHTGGACPFYRSRLRAQNAHLIIVNHALLLADVATGSRVIPDYRYLIVDEGHHLESATTNALSFRATQMDFVRLSREIGTHRASASTPGGALGRLLDELQGSVAPADYAVILQLAERATDHAFQMESQARAFFDTLARFLFEQRDGKEIGPYTQQERIIPATRTQPAWLEVEIAWEETHGLVGRLLQELEQIAQAVSDINQAGYGDPDTLEALYNEIANLYRRLYELSENIERIIFQPEADQIYWAEVRPDGRGLALQAAPLHIGPLVQEHIWHQKDAVVLTSATLTAAGEFDYLRQRLYAADADELALGSPFDYENAALLYIPNNIPEPSDYNGHQRAIEQALIHLCRATGGRTLALFTSYAQLQRTSRAIAPVLAEDDIVVYEQGEGASTHALLETFRDSERAVLLGTKAFWEGVDIPGEDLSVLVIVKLPFAVPSDPIVAARAETFEQPFYQYTIPQAILDFRQGFGRLIRTQNDRGVAVILDRRVLTKTYGRAFLESLPPCTVKVGPLQNLPAEATRWLNL